MRETLLWLVRHAVVDGIAGTIHASDAPADLCDRTRLDALRRHLPQDALSYASPSRRTVETARALELDPILVREFQEQDFGAWTGQRHDELAAIGGEGYAKFWSDPANSRPPGGESFEDQIERVRRGLGQVEAGSATLVVHSGTIRATLCVALDLSPQAALRFVIHPLSLTRIDRLSSGWRVVSVNQRVAVSSPTAAPTSGNIRNTIFEPGTSGMLHRQSHQEGDRGPKSENHSCTMGVPENASGIRAFDRGDYFGA